jgi:hypothetical protein
VVAPLLGRRSNGDSRPGQRGIQARTNCGRLCISIAMLFKACCCEGVRTARAATAAFAKVTRPSTMCVAASFNFAVYAAKSREGTSRDWFAAWCAAMA